MNDDKTERAVERMVDALDARYMAWQLTEVEYDAEIAKITKWAENEYKRKTTS